MLAMTRHARLHARRVRQREVQRSSETPNDLLSRRESQEERLQICVSDNAVTAGDGLCAAKDRAHFRPSGVRQKLLIVRIGRVSALAATPAA